jgi:hypothetical protein
MLTERDGPAEIEITPEMLEGGVTVLYEGGGNLLVEPLVGVACAAARKAAICCDVASCLFSIIAWVAST